MTQAANSTVLIAGAGPAGLAAAITCARAGLPTRVVSKAPPNHAARPLQSLHPVVWPLLQQLGAARVLDACTVARFNGICSAAGEHYFSSHAALSVYGYHVQRSEFDSALLASALDAGVEVHGDSTVSGLLMDNDNVTGFVTRQGQEFRAPILIDATGYARALLRRLGAYERVDSPPLIAHSGLLVVESGAHARMASFEARADGWTWYAPVADHLLSWTTLQASGDRNNPIVADLLLRSVPGSVQIANAQWRLARPLVVKRVLAVGEAGGRLDPAWGLGVPHAIQSGIMAGQAAIDSNTSPAIEGWVHAIYDAWFANAHDQAIEQLTRYYARQNITVIRR